MEMMMAGGSRLIVAAALGAAALGWPAQAERPPVLRVAHQAQAVQVSVLRVEGMT
jgi:hypothetical protein